MDNARAEIVEPLNKLLKEQENLAKSYSAQVAKLDREMRSVHTRLLRAKERSESQLKDTEDVLYTCENYRRNPLEAAKADPQIQDKLNINMGSALRANKEVADAYKSYFQYTKEYENQYKASMAMLMDSYQKLEELQVQTIKDCLRKLLIFETAMDQNRKYDVEHMSSNIEDINAEQCIKTIIDANKNQVGKSHGSDDIAFVTELVRPKSPWYRLFEMYETNYYGKEDFMDYTHIVEETKIHIIRVDDAEYKDAIAKLTALLNSLFANTAPEKAATAGAAECMKNKKGRVAFLDSLHAFSASGRTRVSQTGYKALAMVMLAFLDRSYQELEAELIYQAIGESQKFYWSNDANEKASLLYAIKTHEVWKDGRFWMKSVRTELETEARTQRNILLREEQRRSVQLAERFAIDHG